MQLQLSNLWITQALVHHSFQNFDAQIVSDFKLRPASRLKSQRFRSQKLQNASSPNSEFSKFSSRILPRILLRICPGFFWGVFVLHFVGNGDPTKIHQKSPPFFNAEFPVKYEKNIHNIFLESGQVKEIQITAISVAIPTLVHNRFRGDLVAVLLALCDFESRKVTAMSHCRDCDFAIQALERVWNRLSVKILIC